ncbi:uncharacterized protein KQ657_003746 [Scheffersomyces spartinae]|uniref:Uncharacterized protein n=1 Tax=Scheffersomyces spartinae TaxID=45513 RepID=A0A9P7VCJ5_9ASCO|nr:uncharacterized protein KQ657_003746 [Scheffersomyces spartinae]KAG7195220.1 hypothetical protein KQ657_003746 [Scheffersomyces spartinae]
MLHTSRGSFTDSRAHIRVKRCISINDFSHERLQKSHPLNYLCNSDITLATPTPFCHPLLPSTFNTMICEDDNDAEDEDESDSFCSSSTLLDSPSPSSSLVDVDDYLISPYSQINYTHDEPSIPNPSITKDVSTRLSTPLPPHSLMSNIGAVPSLPTVSLISSNGGHHIHNSLSRKKSEDCLNKMLKKSRFPSKISTLFGTLKTQVTISLNSYLSMLNPRSTDDKSLIISRNQHARCFNPSVSGNARPTNKSHSFQEMATFNVQTPEDLLLSFEETKVQFKQRDLRINSQFLRLYAHDYNLRVLGLMYLSDSDEDEYCDYLGNEYEIDYFNDLSNKSRQKLWKNVILPPRKDNHPASTVDGSCYVFVGYKENSHGVKKSTSSNSLIRLKLNYLPWGQSQPSLKPAGDLRSGKVLLNGQSPNSGVTREQFTIKGWCNPRWLPQVLTEED